MLIKSFSLADKLRFSNCIPDLSGLHFFSACKFFVIEDNNFKLSYGCGKENVKSMSVRLVLKMKSVKTGVSY